MGCLSCAPQGPAAVPQPREALRLCPSGGGAVWSSPHYFFPVSRAVGLEHECGRPVPQAFASLAPLCPGSPPEARARAEERALEARLCPVPAARGSVLGPRSGPPA